MKSLNALGTEHSKTANYKSIIDKDKNHFKLSFSVVKCDKLNTTANVIMSGCGRESNSFGDKCLFYCDHGYKAVSGTKERNCQENGTWSGSPLTCAGKLLRHLFFFQGKIYRPGYGPRPRPGRGPGPGPGPGCTLARTRTWIQTRTRTQINPHTDTDPDLDPDPDPDPDPEPDRARDGDRDLRAFKMLFCLFIKCTEVL